MSNHAPGPWSFDPGFSGKSAFVVDVEGHMIAMLPHADPRGLDNAKLIAAAPELLSVACDAYDYLLCQRGGYDSDAEHGDLIRSLNAIISKVKP